MGLFQYAVETYNSHKDIAGKEKDGREVLAPVAHTTKKAGIIITINNNGEFQSARKAEKNEKKVLIPATEDADGRTSSKIAPYPLCDQLKYLYFPDKKQAYLLQLSQWENSEFTHPLLSAVLLYVKKGSIISDLDSYNILQKDEKNKTWKNDDEFVIWNVTGIGEESGPCWKNSSLIEKYTNYYLSRIEENGKKEICLISGEECVTAKQHPKGIIPINGNAKIISSNDEKGFTFRGRFKTDREACSIGYVTSQKAHNALRWLSAEQGVTYGGRTFLCWNPYGKKVCNPTYPGMITDTIITSPSDYKKELTNTLSGYRNDLPEGKDNIIIASFDAATSGRLSLTYYSELKGSDFYDRIKDWDEHCCWWNGNFGIQSPSLYKIVNYAFGTKRVDKGKKIMVAEDRIMKQQIQNLLTCRVNQARIPFTIKQQLVEKSSQLYLFEDNEESGFLRRDLLFITCSIIMKYHYDYYKEEISMTLEPEKKDRSYQFGRVLAVLEKAERDTYDENEKRETNAIRMQSIFSKQPLHTFRILLEQVKKAYYPRLKVSSRFYYDKLIQEIMEIIAENPENQLNKPLQDTYLIGYYLQKKELYTKKEKEMNNESSEE